MRRLDALRRQFRSDPENHQLRQRLFTEYRRLGVASASWPVIVTEGSRKNHLLKNTISRGKDYQPVCLSACGKYFTVKEERHAFYSEYERLDQFAWPESVNCKRCQSTMEARFLKGQQIKALWRLPDDYKERYGCINDDQGQFVRRNVGWEMALAPLPSLLLA